MHRSLQCPDAGIRSLFLVGALFALAGCSPLTEPILFDDFSCCDPVVGPVTVPFAISPDSVHILRGDTVSFYAWSCGGGIFLCGLSGDVRSNWTIAGNAGAAVLSTGEMSSSVNSATTIVVRGVASGHSDISGVSTSDSKLAKTVRLHVADSSAITAIELTLSLGGSHTLTLPYGGRAATVRLMDASGAVYLSRVAEWSVSDSSVLQVDAPSVNPFKRTDERYIVPKKPGTAEVRVKFLGLSDTLQLTVLP